MLGGRERNECLGLEHGSGYGCGSVYHECGWAGCFGSKDGRQGFGMDRNPTSAMISELLSKLRRREEAAELIAKAMDEEAGSND